MNDSRLTKQVFNMLHNDTRVGSWVYNVRNIMRQIDTEDCYKNNRLCDINLVKDKLCKLDKNDIKKEI